MRAVNAGEFGANVIHGTLALYLESGEDCMAYAACPPSLSSYNDDLV